MPKIGSNLKFVGRKCKSCSHILEKAVDRFDLYTLNHHYTWICPDFHCPCGQGCRGGDGAWTLPVYEEK